MRLVYFARVREAIGVDAETRECPAEVVTVGDCVAWLALQSAAHATALADPTRLRFALDQQMVSAQAALADASELAIFPPVTGG